MNSNMTRDEMRDRVRALLVDAGVAVWQDAQTDEGIRQALEEYSRAALLPHARVRANEAIALVTPGADARQVSLATLTGLVDVSTVWFPYLASYPQYPPNTETFRLLWDDGEPVLFLDSGECPDGMTQARVFYRRSHTLDGLDGATATTFDAIDEGLIALGAAGYACMLRSIDLAEESGQQAIATPNLAALGTRLLKMFRTRLTPAPVAASVRFKNQ